MVPKPATILPAYRTAGLLAGFLFGMMIAFAVLSAVYPEMGLRGLFAPVCHQQPERCHWIGGEPVATCVRCFWLYLGLAIGHLRFLVSVRVPAWRRQFLFIALALAGIDWVSGWLGLTSDWVMTHALTGFGVGVAIANFTLPGLVECFVRSPLQPQPKLS